MPAPGRIALGLTLDGLPTMRVRPIDRTTDLIWDAVQSAQESGMTPQQFQAEVWQAWEHERKDQLKRELQDLR